MEKLWHYAKGGEKHGPITAAQLKELAKTGQLSPDDLVWREDMQEWRQARSVKGLFPEQTTQRPPKQPTPTATSPATGSEDIALWEKPAIVALLVVCFFPVGLYLLWKSPRISKGQKTLWTGAFCGLVVLGMVISSVQRQATEKDLARAKALWNEGKRSEAIAIYQSVLKDRDMFIPDDQKPVVYGRVIDHLAEQGSQDEVRGLLNKLDRSVSPVTPLVETASAKQLLAEVRREKEAEKQKREVESGPSEDTLANIPTSKFVSATSLYKEFNSNEVAADEKYKGQTILVAGKVQSVEKAPLQGTIIYLTYNDYGGLGVHCLLSRSAARSDELKTVSAGDYVKVRGKCDGKSFVGVVMLTSCEFVNVTGN